MASSEALRFRRLQGMEFTVRDGVKFHSGDPLDADAVKYTFDRIMAGKPVGGSQLIAALGDDYSIEKVDQLTIRITSGNLNSRLICSYEPRNSDSEPCTNTCTVSREKIVEGMLQGELCPWLSTHGAGSGPYTVEEFIPKETTTLKKFDGYWAETMAHQRG